MLLSKIKTLISFFDRKKKGSGSYLQSSMQLHEPPGQNVYQSEQSKQRKSIFARFRQLFTKQKRSSQGGYKGPVSKRKMLCKLTGLATVIFSLLIFIVIGGGQILLNNFESLPLFQVADIVFVGAGEISKEKLREASKIILHQTSLIGLDCAQVEAGLRTIPWVGKAVVKKNWPSTVEITIVENVPLALLHNKNASGTQLHYIDRKGVPFLQVPPGADIDFPVITGLMEINDQVVRAKALDETLIFLKKVNGNNPNLPAQSISEIHLTQNGEMVVYLVEYPFPIFFGNSNTSKKYSRLVQVLKTLYKKQNGKGSISQVEYIQMDYLNDKVLVAQSESG